MATDALRVGHFRHGLRDFIRFLYRSPRPLSYFELFNIVLDVEDDHALSRKFTAAEGDF